MVPGDCQFPSRLAFESGRTAGWVKPRGLPGCRLLLRILARLPLLGVCSTVPAAPLLASHCLAQGQCARLPRQRGAPQGSAPCTLPASRGGRGPDCRSEIPVTFLPCHSSPKRQCHRDNALPGAGTSLNHFARHPTRRGGTGQLAQVLDRPRGAGAAF